MLYLKFVVDTGKVSRLVISPALIHEVTGLYEDALYIYTEAGRFHKSQIQGMIEPVIMEDGKEST